MRLSAAYSTVTNNYSERRIILKKLLFILLASISNLGLAIELCGENLTIERVGNYSTGSGGPYIGDLVIVAGGKGYEWRKRYGLNQELLDQTMSLALYAKATGSLVNFYCANSNQTYNARYILVK